MANKKIKKVPLKKECLYESLKLRNLSLNKLNKDFEFSWSSKSVQRGIACGVVAETLLDELGKYLNVDPDYLSGKYHKQFDILGDEETVKICKKNLNANNFPYLKKQLRTKIDGKFIEEKYLEYLLIVHNIEMKQFDDLPFSIQKELLLSIEEAICPLLLKYFPTNSSGKENFEGIYKRLIEIDNYDPDEPTPPEDFFK